MLHRIPLTTVLSAPGSRHEVPSRTYRADLQSSFFRYLDSNDTRIVQHRLVDVAAHPAEDYETYVGEDVWDKKKKQKGKEDDTDHKEEEEEEEGTPREPLPRFDDVVEWVAATMDEPWARDGVVLCGRYAVADDGGAWALPSQSATIYHTHEVFVLMKSSIKFLQDVRAQFRHAAAAQAAATARTPEEQRDGKEPTLQFTLAKAMAGEESREMRVYVPYKVLPRAATSAGGSEGPPHLVPLYDYAGICQRCTDVCLPPLMAWTEAQHDANFRAMLARVKASAVLERHVASDPSFLPYILRRAQRQSAPSPPQEEEGGETPTDPWSSFLLLLAVDVLFDSPTCPIYVLSAKVRVGRRRPPAEANTNHPHQNNNNNSNNTPSADEAPYLAEEVDTDGPRRWSTPSDDQEEEEDHGVWAEESDARFFRLFRDAAHWNTYVTEVVKRSQTQRDTRARERARGAGPRSAADSDEEEEEEQEDEESEVARRLRRDTDKKEKESTTAHDGHFSSSAEAATARRYVVVASEFSDLVNTGEGMEKLGLPLEFFQPELLRANPELMEMMAQMKRDMEKKKF